MHKSRTVLQSKERSLHDYVATSVQEKLAMVCGDKCDEPYLHRRILQPEDEFATFF